jgi:hypothetical protein
MEVAGPDAPQTTPSTVTDEIADRKREADKKEKTCDRESTKFSWLRYTLGVPGAVLAIAAGSTALAGTSTGVTATIAFLAAGFTAAHTLANPDVRRTKYALLQADYADLARRAHRSLIAAATMTPVEQLAALDELNTRMHQLDRSLADTGVGQA